MRGRTEERYERKNARSKRSRNTALGKDMEISAGEEWKNQKQLQGSESRERKRQEE